MIRKTIKEYETKISWFILNFLYAQSKPIYVQPALLLVSFISLKFNNIIWHRESINNHTIFKTMEEFKVLVFSRNQMSSS